MKTKTFEYKDASVDYVITVKEEFLTICPHPQNIAIKDLNAVHKLYKYLHNLDGFAIWSPQLKKGSYRIEGKLFHTKEDWEKAAHAIKFGNKLENIINEN